MLKNRTVDTYGKERDVMIWTLFKADYVHFIWKNIEIQAFDMMDEKISLES